MAKYKKIYKDKNDYQNEYNQAKEKIFIFPKIGDAKCWQAVGQALADLADGTSDMPPDGMEDVADFKLRIGADANLQDKKFPDWVKKVQYVRNDHNRGIFVIRLPDMDLMEDARSHSTSTYIDKKKKDYTRPPCMGDFDANTTREDILKQIFAYYCISHCI